MSNFKAFFSGLIALVLVLTALGAGSTPAQAGNGNGEPKADPRLLQMAEENPDAIFMVIVQREVKNKNVPEVDPEQDVEKEGGKVKKQFKMVESFSAELTGKQILKLATKKKVRWISVDAPMVSTAANPTLRDEFATAAYSNNNGTQTWAGNWAETGDATGIATAGTVKISGGQLQFSSANRTLRREANLSGVALATLTFQYKRSGMDGSSDYVAIQASSNGGSTWTELGRYAGAGSDSTWQTASFNILSYAAAKTQIRFATSSSLGSSDYLYVDNVQIEYALPVPTSTVTPSPYTSVVRADQLPGTLTGQGVTVAVIDSGITAFHPDLVTGGSSRIIASAKFGYNLTTEDLYGHGTHVAGIIGSNGSASNGTYKGMAPNVNLINLKASNEFGMTYESDVVSAMQWVYDNKDAYNIRVVNISMNSTVAQSYHTSPLSAAVEILWFNGVVVVVSAGNNGTADGPSIVYPPANDPFVITVGANEDNATASLTDDTTAVFSAYTPAQSGSLEIRISSSTDDVEEEGADGATLGPGGMYFDSADLEFLRDNEEPVTGTQTIGLRFNGISLPQGATITNAYLSFKAVAPDPGNSNSSAANLTIQGQAADSATPFTTAFYDLSNRSRTTASVPWMPAAWTSGTLYDSPDLTAIVQEIVNRPGWNSGNSMAFVIRCTDGTPTTNCGSRSAASWDSSSSNAALLHIEWAGGIAKPELIAPGRNIVAPLGGVFNMVFQLHPLHRVNDYYFRMSGTSMSAPVVSGAVALLLQDEPSLTPDQVKYRLMTTANKSWSGYDTVKAGAGTLDVYAAVNGTSTESANTGIIVSQMLSTGSDPVTWGSVGWNSVGWNSVGWNSVGWNSVGWNSVGWNSVGWNTSTWDD